MILKLYRDCIMRTFTEFPKNVKCPICNTNKNSETMLIGKVGTEDGNNMQASPIHTDCLDLRLDEKRNFIFQVLTDHRFSV